MLQPDTSEGVQAFAPIDPGTYQAKITAALPKTSKAGNPMLELKVEVTVNGDVKKRTSYVNVTGKGAFGFDNLLRATNFDSLADTYKDSTIPASQKPAFDEQTLVGQSVQVVIEHEMNSQTGQPTDRIRSWLKA